MGKNLKKNIYIGLAKKFVRLVTTLFNKVLSENEKFVFLLKADEPSIYICTHTDIYVYIYI